MIRTAIIFAAVTASVAAFAPSSSSSFALRTARFAEIEGFDLEKEFTAGIEKIQREAEARLDERAAEIEGSLEKLGLDESLGASMIEKAQSVLDKTK